MSMHRSDASRPAVSLPTAAPGPLVLDVASARAGVADGHLVLAFQPIVCLSHGLSQRSQVVARWRAPGDRTRPLQELVAGADVDGTAAVLGRAVLHRAALAMEHAGPSAAIAVRLAGAQFRDPSLPSAIDRVLASHGLESGSISIQVPAMTALVDITSAIGTLHALRELGCPVGLVDVGSTIGSLSQMHRLPLDFVQLSRTTIGGLLLEPDVLSLVGTLLRIADDRGLPTIADGVESIEQLDWLRDLGCRFAQGPVVGPQGLAPDLPSAHQCLQA
jgi:EAL domain-containing protein (putative c-di-GMP-specific phosphodiesterase class I)